MQASLRSSNYQQYYSYASSVANENESHGSSQHQLSNHYHQSLHHQTYQDAGVTTDSGHQLITNTCSRLNDYSDQSQITEAHQLNCYSETSNVQTNVSLYSLPTTSDDQSLKNFNQNSYYHEQVNQVHDSSDVQAQQIDSYSSRQDDCLSYYTYTQQNQDCTSNQQHNLDLSQINSSQVQQVNFYQVNQLTNASDLVYQSLDSIQVSDENHSQTNGCQPHGDADFRSSIYQRPEYNNHDISHSEKPIVLSTSSAYMLSRECYFNLESKSSDDSAHKSQESLFSSAASASSDDSSSSSSPTRDEKRAREANIPMSYIEIVNLSIEQFNEQLSRHKLSESQLTLIKDIRRRGKNKVAAQSCRKRKMEQINELQHEVNDLESKRRSLRLECNQLANEHETLIQLYEKIGNVLKSHLQIDVQHHDSYR